MKYTLLGKTGLRVSELALGTMTFGEDWGWGASKDICEELVRTYLEAGGNFIDTANYYTNGSSEKILGEIVKDIRNEVVLSTKYSLMTNRKNINSGGNHRKNMVESLEQSLKRLQTDHIDVFWVHILDYYTPVEEVMRGLDDLVSSGKILYAGISDTPAWVIAKANTIAEERNWTRFNAMQLEYNLLERTSERELIPMAERENLSVMAWSPLAGGLLSGKYNSKNNESTKGNRLEKSKRINEYNLAIADVVISIARELDAIPSGVALAWLRQNPKVIPVIGARNVNQLKENLNCLQLNLSSEHLAKLNEVSKINLGFPHDFIASDGVRDILYGDFSISI